MNKTELRRAFRAELSELSAAERAAAAVEICRELLAHPAWGEARVVAVFAPLPSEPDLAPLWAAKGPRALCCPRVEGETMAFYRVDDPTTLPVTRGKLCEPPADPTRLVSPGEIDLVLVPGVAFTSDGERLGRGGGFYDRYLGQPDFRAATIGVCFDCQLAEELPVEAHDAEVDDVITG